jgi:hypothetical protein
VSEATIGILVDYESPLARRVAGDVWSGLSRAALEAGVTKTTALWESLRETRSPKGLEGPLVHVFTIGQDRPDAIDAVAAIGDPAAPHLYGIIVERLTGTGVKAGMVEPALLHANPVECERYARRLLERLRIP